MYLEVRKKQKDTRKCTRFEKLMLWQAIKKRNGYHIYQFRLSTTHESIQIYITTRNECIIQKH